VTHPPPEPRPRVRVVEARAIAGTLGRHRRKPTWVLRLECGHETRRQKWGAPEYVLCADCPPVR